MDPHRRALQREVRISLFSIRAQFLMYYFLDSCRLWNELTIKLVTFVRHESLQDESSLLQLYQNFISTFETK